MNKFLTLLFSGVLLVSVAACDNNEKTSDGANSDSSQTSSPAATGAASPNASAPASPSADASAQPDQGAKNDASSDVRKRQLESDIRAREQRNNAAGDPLKRADSDLESEVRSKLEANLPSSKLEIDAKDGAVTVVGTVEKPDQVAKIEPLAKEIKGVKTVAVQAKVAPAQKN
ncbi:BON domain-containing protein [Coleofasciculus sp. FACHB-64]|uniref:BON domain-containing protein n=1 Tax=Cyanophyceae TaxID=3028117 RepID=UPI00168513E2|nr:MULTISPECIES: BON domain-containing protein [unclassified Coleofasciculus]MBD1839298.1 BON domain-containing protein [Coleofasciculus sp. FACHB-501]MBD1888751.1 BON domain-containing protein [Coleofasciculus sp. FACHB-SPT9]MBD2045625.1 BON domain-containing protein [Coleofasciculus sp. FACHB-64]